jgi:DNA-binding LytR/AlgR family response regulator
VPFSLAHILAMVGIRKAVYLVIVSSYHFGPWSTALVYEYLKDFRSYAFLAIIIYLYLFILRRLQGEAEFLSEGREEQPPAPVTDRFLVRKLGRDFLVRVGEIDWVEASGNYVNLYVGKRAYPLRETMIGIEQRLEPHGFLRVHRSAIVNLERIRALVPGEAGDGAVQLDNEQEVPVSRRYRKSLRERVQASRPG